MDNQLYLDTPLTQAIGEFFGKMEAVIQAQAQGLTINAYLFGGCALHIHTNARGSSDVDVHLEAVNGLSSRDILLQIEAVYYIDSDGEFQALAGDTGFNTSIASVAPDFEERAIKLHFGNGLIDVHLVGGTDLAVSKLGRGQAQDMDDILSLYKSGKFTISEFKALADDAGAYYINPPSLKRNA